MCSVAWQFRNGRDDDDKCYRVRTNSLGTYTCSCYILIHCLFTCQHIITYIYITFVGQRRYISCGFFGVINIIYAAHIMLYDAPSHAANSQRHQRDALHKTSHMRVHTSKSYRSARTRIDLRAISCALAPLAVAESRVGVWCVCVGWFVGSRAVAANGWSVVFRVSGCAATARWL